MRIAVVLPRGSNLDRSRINSMEAVALTLNRWSRFKADVRFICEAGAETPVEAERTLTVAAGLGKAAHEAAIVAQLRAFQPDLIEYHQQLGCAAEIARRLPGRPQVLYRHTRIKPPANPLDRWRYSRRLKVFERLIFVSRAAREEFLADYPSFDDRAVVVCNPIDVETWYGDPAHKEKLILFAGRAMQEKGLDALCLALAETLDKAPEWRAALMLGDWDRHQAWAEPHLAALARFGDRIEVVRSASPEVVRAAARRAAIAVVPSRVAEALGLAALEAHAAGAALISSGRGGLREASGAHAVYVDPPEAAPLACALLSLTRDDARRIALAREGQAFVAQTHAPALRAAELDALRLSLTQSPSPAMRPVFVGLGRRQSLTEARR